MDFVYVTDNEFMNSKEYIDFMNNNPGEGNLKIRAYAASEALPVSGIRIVVSTMIGSRKVVFYDGVTDASGMIEKLSLPAPRLELNNMEIPSKTTYEVDAISSENEEMIYNVDMYDGICVLQNINYIPNSLGGFINGN